MYSLPTNILHTYLNIFSCSHLDLRSRQESRVRRGPGAIDLHEHRAGLLLYSGPGYIVTVIE